MSKPSGNPSVVLVDTTAPRFQKVWENIRSLDERLPVEWSLRPAHQEAILGSGVDLDTACYAGVFSADAELAHRLVGTRQSCLIFPYWGPYGRKLYTLPEGQPFYRGKLDIPNGDQKFASFNAGGLPYWPRIEGFNWLDTPGIGHQVPSAVKKQTLLVSQGELEALCGTLNGYPTLGLQGVWGWLSASDELGAELKSFDWSLPKSIVLAFNADVAHESKFVMAGRKFAENLVREWEEQRAKVEPRAQWHHAQKLNKKLKYVLLPTTVDDVALRLDEFIARYKKKGLTQLVTQALPLQSLKEGRVGLSVTALYTGEPLGPYSPKEGGLDRIQATHFRGLLCKYSLASDVRHVPDHGGMRYNPELGIWEEIGKGAWGLLPETVCRVNGWQNRSPVLKGQNFDLAKEELAIPFDRFNHPRYIGFRNGVLISSTARLVPHSRDYYLTRRLGFNYDLLQECPMFLTFLHGMCASQELVEVIRALFRWSLEPKEKGKKYSIEIWPILLGPPGSGKSTLLYILQALAGFKEGAATFSIKSLQGREPEKKLAKLLDKYVAIDSDFKGHLGPEDVALLNKVTSNEEVEIKRLWQDEHSTCLNTVLWAAANRMPSVSNGDGGGFSRRSLILKILARTGPADPNLVDNLLCELSGIYNWMRGLSLEEAKTIILAYKNSGTSLDILQEQVVENNTAIAWLISWVERSEPEERVGYAREFYELYVQWCADEGHRNTLKKRSFTRYLKEAGMVEIARHGEHGWRVQLPAASQINWKGIG